MSSPPDVRYPCLSKQFFKGSIPGQIASIYKYRSSKPEKLEDYKRALEDGAISLGRVLTNAQVKKLTEMGVPIHQGIIINSFRSKKVV